MKKVIFMASLLLLVAAPTTVFGQNAKAEMKKEQRAEMTPEQKAQKKTDRLTKALALTETQQKEIHEIHLQQVKNQEQLKAERTALKEKHKAQKQAHQSQVDAILTDEQKAKLDELKAKQAEQRKAKRKM